MPNDEIGFADQLPEKQVFESGAVRASGGKAKIALVSPHLINETAKVLTFGAQKYSERNWEKGFPWSDCYSALQRHLNAWWAGEELEGESGLHHLGFAACNLMFLIHFAAEKGGTDDRYPLSSAMNFTAKPEGVTWPEKERRAPPQEMPIPSLEELEEYGILHNAAMAKIEQDLVAACSMWFPVDHIGGDTRQVLWKRKCENGFAGIELKVFSLRKDERSLPDYGFCCEIPS
jgi:hypothetical protein